MKNIQERKMDFLNRPIGRVVLKKYLVALCLFSFFAFSLHAKSQKVNIRAANESIQKVLSEIENQTDYLFVYDANEVNVSRKVSVNASSKSVEEVLADLFNQTGVVFRVEGNNIILVRGAVAAKADQQVNRMISGKIVDENGEAIIGANVTVVGNSTIGTVTDIDGNFSLFVEENAVLKVTYIGYLEQSIPTAGKNSFQIVLLEDVTKLEEVVVTGIYQREKESFTGSTATYTAKELKIVGNQNVLQSLKTLDPSFAIVENNLFGSDPNRLSDIEIRGKSSVIGLTEEYSSNPNQPLFILDGFESTLAIISDLSMDRVVSITLLKDAASTAIYGSKAANGVVVVETKRPVAGQLRVNYTFNGNVSFADLTDYNLMNAEEKLQFEFLSQFYGLLDENGQIILGANLNNEALYYDRLKEVRRGVNTYWASEPLRTAFTQRHTLFAEGGDANLRYSVSLNHGITNGVMKGSERTATNGNIRLLYKRGAISFTNSLSIDNVLANKEASPFSDFSRANPYHRKYNADGSVKMVLEDFSATRSGYDPVYSPLYNERNLNINEQGSQGFTNNFELEWRAMESLRVRGRFGLRSFKTRDEVFRSPFNTEFLDTDPLERGKYQETNGKNLHYDGDLTVTFGKLLAKKHMLNVVGGARMEQANKQLSSYQVFGFIDDEFSNPNFALQYPEGKRPEYSESRRRGASFFMNMGYAYDQRYLMDATLRSDGSSVFGAEKQFSNIWSFGLAWNAHNEEFLKEKAWINQLRLRGSIGNPGNQNFDDYISMRIYRYNNEIRNPFGASTLISNMGNRNLKWQTTLDRNIGLDFITLKNRLRFNLDYFVKTTDPLLVFVSLPTSTGMNQVAQNIGAQVTRGFTATVDYTFIQRNEFNWKVNMNMRQLKSEYRDMGNRLSNFNEVNKSRNMVRYYDGGSPSDLWAVRSLGIDPATGREIFLNKNNEQTFVHNYQDEVVVGNSEPDLEGIIGTTVYYKGFTASANFRYRYGGQAFMKTLFEKVENISARNVALNQDKRALYDRWQKPGDQAKFKAITQTAQTPMSSRFVEDNNVLTGESFSVGYETTKAAWLKYIFASSVTFRVYMNDIFYMSTIKDERGLDYPFARTVSFSAAIRF